MAPPPSRSMSPTQMDTGWGWLVVAAVFVERFFTIGVTRSSGLFLLRLVDYYQVTTVHAGMALTLALFVFAIGAPVATVVGESLTPRRVVMFGGLVGLGGLAVSGLMVNLPVVIIMFGLALGVGNSCSYGNGMVMVGKYFRDKRGVATTIALFGTSFGQFFLPLLIEYLLNTFGLGGALLISGALYSHTIVAGALLRPIAPSYRCEKSGSISSGKAKRLNTDKGDDDDEEDCLTDDEDDFMDDIDEEEDDDDDGDEGDNESYYSTQMFHRVSNGNIHLHKKPTIDTIIEVENNNGQEDTDLCLAQGRSQLSRGGHPKPNKVTIPEIVIQNEKNELFHLPLNDEWNVLYGGNRSCSRLGADSNRRRSDDSGSLTVWKRERSGSASDDSMSKRSSLNTSHASLYCKRAAGKVARERKGRGHVDTDAQQHEKSTGCEPFVNLVFDFSVLGNINTRLFIAVTFLYFLVQCNFVFFLPGILVDKGFNGFKKSIVIAIIGLGDLLARIGAGLPPSGLIFIQRFKLKAVVTFLASVNLALFIPATSFTQLSIHGFLHGLFCGIVDCLLPGMLTDFVGVSMWAQTLGVVLLFQGMGGAIGHPLLGLLKDVTGSYQSVSTGCSIAMLLCCFLLLLYPAFRRQEDRRDYG